MIYIAGIQWRGTNLTNFSLEIGVQHQDFVGVFFSMMPAPHISQIKTFHQLHLIVDKLLCCCFRIFLVHDIRLEKLSLQCGQKLELEPVRISVTRLGDFYTNDEIIRDNYNYFLNKSFIQPSTNSSSLTQVAACVSCVVCV